MAQLDAFADFDPHGKIPALLRGDDVVTEGTRGSWAVFSRDRVYRYLLGRVWDDHAPLLILGMLNPSKAGTLDNDPTVRRGIGFAKRDRYGGLIVWNACALIATDPRELVAAYNPEGPRNLDAMYRALGYPLARSVLAWGRPLNAAIGRRLRRAYINAASVCPSWRFGKPTKEGWPRHPLYLRSDTPIVTCGNHP